jgi:hypothetical protein
MQRINNQELSLGSADLCIGRHFNLGRCFSSTDQTIKNTDGTTPIG